MKIAKKLLILLGGTFSIASTQMLSFSQNDATNSKYSNSFSIKAVQASTNSVYVPPKVKKNPRLSQGSGSRGCEQLLLGQENLVKLLIPSKEYVGQTASGHPTFFWYLAKPVSVPMEFAIIKPGVSEPILVKKIDSATAGIIAIALPQDEPELQTGETYKWSVSLVCNKKRPSANPLFYSWIERVPTSPELSKQLANLKTKNDSAKELHDRALVYGQAGLWYDTLATLDRAMALDPQNPTITADFNSLLDRAGITY
jgi:hypothetical protein